MSWAVGAPAPSIVVMGVSGCGKSTVGGALAATLGADFLDADDLHPRRNRDRMAAGVPLTDDDRWPWLDLVAAAMRAAGEEGRGMVVACSALRRVHRDRLVEGAGTCPLFVHLSLGAETIADRLAARRGHFMPSGLLASQLSTLEALEDDEHGVVVDGTAAPAALAELLAARGAAGHAASERIPS